VILNEDDRYVSPLHAQLESPRKALGYQSL
jgi:hypothetical protein